MGGSVAVILRRSRRIWLSNQRLLPAAGQILHCVQDDSAAHELNIIRMTSDGAVAEGITCRARIGWSSYNPQSPIPNPQPPIPNRPPFSCTVRKKTSACLTNAIGVSVIHVNGLDLEEETMFGQAVSLQHYHEKKQGSRSLGVIAYGGFDAAGSRAYRALLAQGHYRCPHCRRADIDEINHTPIVRH